MQQTESRKAVEGVVFADITGSTTLFEKLGDAEAHAIVTRVLDALEELAEEKGGRTLKKIGDEVLCVFPDAASAVQFGMSAQRQLAIHAGGRRIELRIGVNYGPLVEDRLGDVFGDTVNVAARLRGLASPGQVITTQDTLDAVSAETRISTRRLGSHALAGKDRMVQVVEVLWEDQQLGNLTQMPQGPMPELQSHALTLRLEFQGSGVELKSEDSRNQLSIGRDPSNLMVVSHDSVSRRHATISVRMGKFYLRDHSTNGTYVRIGSNRPIVVRREAIPMHGRGEISLGQDFSAGPDDCITFEVSDTPTV